MSQSTEWQKADDAAYRLRAILRTIERDARDIAEHLPPGNELVTPLNDFALLSEIGQDLADRVHLAMAPRPVK